MVDKRVIKVRYSARNGKSRYKSIEEGKVKLEQKLLGSNDIPKHQKLKRL